MKNIIIPFLLLFPPLSNAGYYYNGICHSKLRSAVSSYVIENHGQTDIYWDNAQAKYVTAIKWLDPTLATTSLHTSVYSPYPRNCINNNGGEYYCQLANIVYYQDWDDLSEDNTQSTIILIPQRYRLKTATITTPTWSEYVFTPVQFTICDTNISQIGFEPVNLNVTYPPDTFNPSNINPVDAVNSIGSGFLLIAVPLAVVWAGRHFLRPLFKI